MDSSCSSPSNRRTSIDKKNGKKPKKSILNKSVAEEEEMDVDTETKSLPNGTGGELLAKPPKEVSSIDLKDEEEEILDVGSPETEKESSADQLSKSSKDQVDKDDDFKDDSKDIDDKEQPKSTGSAQRRQSRSRSQSNLVDTAKSQKEAERIKTYNSDSDSEFYGFESPIQSSKEAFLRAIEKEGLLSALDSPLNDFDENEDGDLESEMTVSSETFTPGLRQRRTRKSSRADLSNPDYKKPFEYGWLRELVYRSSSDSGLRRNADVYYYTPSGKKVRSGREILEHLNDDLTINHFTFLKEPIGLDSTKEIIREAKSKVSGLGDDISSPVAKKQTPKAKRSSSPKVAPSTSDVIKAGSTLTPKVAFKGSAQKRKITTVRMKTGGRFPDKKRKSAGPDDEDMDPIDIDPDPWSPEIKLKEVCSIDCRLALGIIPTIKCHTCLCLYHPECMGLTESKHRSSSYSCKYCQLAKSRMNSTTAPTPSTPAPSTTAQATSKPKETLTKPSKSKTSTANTSNSQQPIVGALTTWLSSSSSIQVSTPPASAPETPSAQPLEEKSVGIVKINCKDYVIIPKHNVVSVSNNGGIPAGSHGRGSGGGVSTAPGYVASPHSNPSHGVVLVPLHPTQASGHTTNGVKRSNSSPDSSAAIPEKKMRSKDSDDGLDDKLSFLMTQQRTKYKTRVSPPTHNSWMVVNDGFMGLLHSFQYLKVHELLRASCVSKMWALVASHYSLWETVRMKNSRVRDWKGFGKTLKEKKTKCLDLRKMLLPENNSEISNMWRSLGDAIIDCQTLVKIDMGRCTPHAIQCVVSSCPQLESIATLAVKGNELDMECLLQCQTLKEIRLKSIGGIELKNIICLSKLKHLKHLSLTAIKSLEGVQNLNLPQLESLELGECPSLPKGFAVDALPLMKSLKRLRLEKGQGDCPTQAILATISSLPRLTQLELINFDIKPGFDKSLAKCSNIRTLLIIPTYVTQSATTNHVVMGGVSKLSTSLTYFIWGLTLELLRVTDLFIDQVEGQKGKTPNVSIKKATAGDSIPILKPLGEESDDGKGGASHGKDSQQGSQVDILALPKLQRVLSTLLPTTKIKILKVPFSATWRQTVTDVPL